MRKPCCILLAVVLSVSLFISCSSNPSQIEQPTFKGETYRSASDRAAIEKLISDNTWLCNTMNPSEGSFIMQDIYTLQGCNIASITFPVYATKTADKKGNYYVTVSKFKVTNGVFGTPVAVYRIAVNGKQYGLQDNQSKICSLIDVDVTSYGIEVGENEVLGMCAADDTLTLFYLSSTSSLAMKEIGNLNPKYLGFFKKSSGSDYSCAALLADFAWFENGKTAAYQQEEAYYESLIASLKSKYSGKYLSVIGDSISTYGGISNDPTTNSTIGSNAVYYKTGAERMPSALYMYWNRLATDLDMNLCVVNSYSGSYVYGKKSLNYVDAGVVRATELDNDNGTPSDPSDDINPDLILVYIGVNDMHGLGVSKSTEIFNMVTGANGNKEKLFSLMDEWFAGVLENTDGAENLVHDDTYKTFDQAYTLMLYRMIRKYPNAQILAMDMRGSNSTHYTESAATRYNLAISTICEYLNDRYASKDGSTGSLVCLDWSETLPLTKNNAKFYTADAGTGDTGELSLHPNANENLRMEREILKELAGQR